MKVVLQRVIQGRVLVDDVVVGQVEKGYVLLVGITHTDTPDIIKKMADKVAYLRVFEDEAGKMNRSILDVGGGILVVSQFTLYGDARRGRRPSYSEAARPEVAEPLIEAFADALRGVGISQVAMGQFGATMLVDIQNDGPVTIILEM